MTDPLNSNVRSSYPVKFGPILVYEGLSDLLPCVHTVPSNPVAPVPLWGLLWLITCRVLKSVDWNRARDKEWVKLEWSPSRLWGLGPTASLSMVITHGNSPPFISAPYSFPPRYKMPLVQGEVQVVMTLPDEFVNRGQSLCDIGCT